MTNPPTMTATEPGRDELASIVMKQTSYITRGIALNIVDAILARLSTPANQAVREAALTFTAVVDRENVVHSHIETHGSSFADAYDALLKVWKEITHQVDERRNCPAYRASRECPGCFRIAPGCSSPNCPMVARSRSLTTEPKRS